MGRQGRAIPAEEAARTKGGTARQDTPHTERGARTGEEAGTRSPDRTDQGGQGEGQSGKRFQRDKGAGEGEP